MYAQVIRMGKIIDKGKYTGCKLYKEKYPEQSVTLGFDKTERTYVCGDNCDRFRLFFEEGGSLYYDSDFRVEHDVPKEECQFRFKNCEGVGNQTWVSKMGTHINCCEPCFDERQRKEDDIERKYGSGLTPFTGANEFGEYYDEDSY